MLGFLKIDGGVSVARNAGKYSVNDGTPFPERTKETFQQMSYYLRYEAVPVCLASLHP